MNKTIKKLKPFSWFTLIAFTVSSITLFNPQVLEACCGGPPPSPAPTLIIEDPPPPPTCPPVNGGWTTGASGGGGTACIGTPMKLDLTYNSKDPYQGTLGRGWTHNFNMNLIPGNKAIVNATIIAPSTPYWRVEFWTYRDGRQWWGSWSSQGAVMNFEWDGNANWWSGGSWGYGRVPDGTYTLWIYAWYPGSYTAYTTKQVTVGDYTVMREDGERQIFQKNLDGTYSPKTPGVYSILIKNQDNTFTLIDKDQEICLFTSGGKPTQLIDKNGNIVRLVYDESARLSEIQDPSGRTTTLTYAPGNNLISSIIDPINRTTTFQYNTNNLLSSITDPVGNITAYTYGDQFRITNITKNGIIRQSIRYDFQGRAEIVYDGELNPTTYTYQPASNRTLITDARGNTNIYTYNANYRITKIENPYGNIISHTYDSQNNLTLTTDPLNHTTRYEYDTMGNLTKEIDAKNNETVMAYDGNNNLISKIDPLGREYQYFYDSNNNLIKVQDPINGRTLYTYNTQGDPLTIQDANNHTTENTYDEFGNVIKAQDAEGNETEYTYDLSDRKLSQKDPEGNTTNYTYNEIDKLTKITFHDGTYEEFIYDCCKLTLRKDQSGNETNYTYDTNNRLTGVQDPEGGLTQYRYDAVGNRTKIIDPRGNETTYTYDANNRLTSIAYPTTQTETYTYDSAGRMITKQDDNGNTTTYEYDELNRPTKKIYPDGTFVSYSYDKVGNQITMTDTIGLTTNTYDELNRLTTIDGPFDNDTVSYTYDPVGNRTQMQDQTASKTEYKYDNINRLKELHYTPSGSTTPQITKYDYDLAANLEKMEYPNGVIADYDYNNLNRLINLVNRKSSPLVGEGGGEGVLSSYGYELTPAGMRKSITLADGGRIDYTYDNTYQLLGEVQKGPDGTITYNADYTYDANGNRLTKEETEGITPILGTADFDPGTFNVNSSGNYVTVYLTPMPTKTDKAWITQINNTSIHPIKAEKINTESVKFNRQAVSEASKGYVNQTITYTLLWQIGDKIYQAQTNQVRIIEKGTPGKKSDSPPTQDLPPVLTKEGKVTYTYNEQNQLTTSVSNGTVTTYTYDKNGNLTKKTGTELEEPDELILTQNTVALWHMNEGSGDTINDESPNNNNGSIYGATWVDGRFGKALQFDGVDDWAGLSRRLQIADTFTMELWAYPLSTRATTSENNTGISGTSDQRYAIYPDWYGTNVDAGAGISVGTNGISVFEHADSYLPSLLVYDTPLTDWSHIVIVYENKQPRLYLNGNFVKSGLTSTKIVHPSISRIGGMWYGWFHGMIDEVAIYDRALTDEEISIHGSTRIIPLSSTTYTYDYENRLTKITYPDGNVDEYVYDGLGRKVRATENGVTTNYLYDGLNVTTERDITGNAIRSYSLGFGLDRPISVTLNTQSSTPHYYLFDGLGSTIGLTDTFARSSASYTYDAWGNVLSETGQVSQPYRFTTRPYNITSGFMDLRARAYNPSIGRFIQRDPLGLDPDVNLYRYVGNNPVNWIDPTGLGIIGDIIDWCSEWIPCRFARTAYCESKFGSPCRAGCSRYDELSNEYMQCIAQCSINHAGCLSSNKCPYKGE